MRDSQPPTAERKLSKLVKNVADRAGLDWGGLADQCTELVVFGSQATGFQTRSSDLDLLLVGTQSIALPRVTGIDLIFMQECELFSPGWLKSELAGHIAVYGQWLKGSGQWRMKAIELLGQSGDAADAKQRRIDRLIKGLCNHWDRLTPDFRRRNLLTLRREKQRYELLRSGFAIPPTRLLDLWAVHDASGNGIGFPQIEEQSRQNALPTD